jgi:1-deoxy-D-xylulose-5-phosphate synthase
MDYKKINYKNIKKLSLLELERYFNFLSKLYENLSNKTRTHYASNISSIISTIALAYNLDFKKHKIFFDTGHQTYTYKILTGRIKQFLDYKSFELSNKLQNPSESEFDIYSTGHSGNSLSTALGYLRSTDNKEPVFVYIGDGAFSNGMIYEALNQIKKEDNIKIIINNNSSSITENKSFLDSDKSKDFFSNFNLKYYSIQEGRNIAQNIKAIKNMMKNKNAAVLNIKNPLSSYFIDNIKIKEGSYHNIFSSYKSELNDLVNDSLNNIMSKNKDFYILNPSMVAGLDMHYLKKVYKERFLDTKITEANTLSMAAGMAINNKSPIVCIYSTFLNRAYDQMLHDIDRNNLNVKIIVYKPFKSNYEGSSHDGHKDINMYKSFSNCKVISISDKKKIPSLLEKNLIKKGFFIIRLEIL